MSDRVFIRGLAAETIVGVHAWERLRPRPLLLDLELDTDLRAAADSDDVADAIDYQRVSDAARETIAGLEPALIETLAEAVAQTLLAEFAVSAVRVTLYKPGAVAGVREVGISIERRREG